MPPPNEIRVVGLDDETFVALGVSPRLPFPRRYFADALDTLVTAKPSLVILDFVGVKESEDEIANSRMESALRQLPSTMIGAFPVESSRETGETLKIDSDPRFLNAVNMSLSMRLRSERSVVWNLSTTADRATSTEDLFPLLKPLQKFLHVKIDVPDIRGLINYYGPAGAIPRYSLYQLIKDPSEQLIQDLNNKVIFLGHHSAAIERGRHNQEEFFVTASAEPIYGVEIHANIAGNLIDDHWIRRLSKKNELTAVFLVLFGLLYSVSSLSPTNSWFLILGFFGIWAISTYIAVVNYYFLIPGFGIFLVAAFFTIGPLSLLRTREAQKALALFRERLGIDREG